MKKILAVVLAALMVVSVPVAYACVPTCYNFDVDSGITISAYCTKCNEVTSCEYCSRPGDIDYQYSGIDCHAVYTYYETVCTVCNTRWGRNVWYSTCEKHVFDDCDGCIVCGG